MSEKPETIKVPRGGIMKISKRLGTSPLVVSRVLDNKYASPTSDLANRIRQAAELLNQHEAMLQNSLQEKLS